MARINSHSAYLIYSYLLPID